MKSLSTREIAKPSHGTTSVEVKLKNFVYHLSSWESNSHREEITKLMFSSVSSSSSLADWITTKLTFRALALRRQLSVADWITKLTFLSVSPSSSLADWITKLTFRALALRRHFADWITKLTFLSVNSSSE